MSAHPNTIVWIDHTQARVFGVGPEDVERQVVHTHALQRHLHHKANSRDSGHAAPDNDFFERVCQSVLGTGILLVVGPANAKTELVHFIKSHHPQLAERVCGVEPLDHPSDGALIAYARKFFHIN